MVYLYLTKEQKSCTFAKQYDYTLELQHKKLKTLLQKAYSAEKAAAFAYQGHAGAVKDVAQKAAIKQIEIDEWHHRQSVLKIMEEYKISVSKYYEAQMYVVGKAIHISCYLIGWFMPFYFAGSLESGNVCEYFKMIHYFHEIGITKHDNTLYEMGMKEKEHEIYFLSKIKNHKLLPFFEKVFSWGNKKAFNDVDLDKKYSVEMSALYCKNLENKTK